MLFRSRVRVGAEFEDHMKSLEQRIEAIERSAKRWKLATLAAVGLCCFVGAGNSEATFDVVKAREFRCVDDKGNNILIGDGLIACRKVAIVGTDPQSPACVIGYDEGEKTGYAIYYGVNKGDYLYSSGNVMFKSVGGSVKKTY